MVKGTHAMLFLLPSLSRFRQSSRFRASYRRLIAPQLKRHVERCDDLQQEARPKAGRVRIAQDDVVLGAPVSAPPEGEIAVRLPGLVDDPAADRKVPAEVVVGAEDRLLLLPSMLD